jgi:hypothetical protein
MAKKETGAVKKGTNPLVFVGVGCLVLLVLLGVGSALAFKFFAKSIGTGMVEKAIEAKTGVKTDISNLEDGKMTFTDSKTGAQVNIGTGEIPATFPKDFPVYPGAKVTSSLSGAEAGKNNGYWLTFETADTADKVSAFYKTEFAKNGWTVESTFTADGTMTQAVKKADWRGSLSLAKNTEDVKTQIVVILGQEQE